MLEAGADSSQGWVCHHTIYEIVYVLSQAECPEDIFSSTKLFPRKTLRAFLSNCLSLLEDFTLASQH